MKKRIISDAIGNIDLKYVEEAENFRAIKRRPSWVKIGALAACLCLLAAGAGAVIGQLRGATETPIYNNGDYILFESLNRNYKSGAGMGSSYEVGLIIPKEYLADHEFYTTVNRNNMKYRSRGIAIPGESIGELIGKETALGYEEIGDIIPSSKSFSCYEIKGVERDLMIALDFGGVFYGYLNYECDLPATLGEFLEAVNLNEYLDLNRYSKGNKYYTFEDESFVWEVLGSVSEAKKDENVKFSKEKKDISFTATSDTLGFYKKVIYITSDGYLKTNIFDHSVCYDIGEDAAERIMDYLSENSKKAEEEPYLYMICGKVSEVGADYILIDDREMCKNPRNGLIFRLSLGNKKMYYMAKEVYDLEVGDTVIVSFKGKLTENYEIIDPVSIDIPVPGGGIRE